jgi:hypothetical protein
MLNDHPGLFVTAAFLYLLLPALFVALGSWLIWMGIKSAHPRRLNFDEEGITFDLRDGSQVRQPWNELYSVDRFGFLRFLDGRKFRVLPGPRGFRILRAAQDAFIKPPVPRDVCRRMAWRWGVLSVVVAGFAALASYVLPEGGRGLHPALIVTLVLAVTMGLGATAIMAEVGCVDPLSRYLFRKSAAFERRNHRKRMAKLRRASLTSDVRAD